MPARPNWHLIPCRCRGGCVEHTVRITEHRARLLDLVSQGHDNPAIGAELGIARRTVDKELEQLREATGCHSKRELAHWWFERRRIYEAGRRASAASHAGRPRLAHSSISAPA
jgi:DNA-binding CsgD family transcriptional regulator